MIDLQTFGGLILRSNGREVTCPRKTALLLVLLADAGELYAKHATMLLWPSVDESRGLHSLNQALYTLRRITGKDAIASTGGSLRLMTRISWDYCNALTRLASADVAGALELIRGEFLAAVDIEKGDAFEEWRDHKRVTLDAQLYRAVESELNLLLANRDWKRLQQFSESAQRVFPRSGILHIARIKALIGRGLTEEYTLAYEAFTSRADAGLIDLPAGYPTLADIARSIKVTGTQPLERSPFVGRVLELQALQESLAQARAGKGNVVVVTGTAGIGKTTLCDAFVSRAVGQGVRVISGAAYPTARHIGYNVLAEALQPHVLREDLETLPTTLRVALAELLPDVDSGKAEIPATQLGPEAAQRRLFEAVSRLLQLLSENETLLILLDDVHWADDATLLWLNYFARRCGSHRILILVTTRLEDRQRLLVKEIVNVRNAPVRELLLKELTITEAFELVRRTKPDWSTDDLTAELARVTGGHPLLLAEALKSGSIQEAKFPGAVHLKYVAAQLGLLAPEHRRLLEWLAVAGTPLSSRMLSALADVSAAQIGHDIDQLSGFITGIAGGLLAFKHDLIRESVYRAIPEDKRTLLHNELAHELQRVGGAASLLAHHFQEGGLKQEALRYALEAAAHSELIHAYPEAEYFYRLAIDVVGDKSERISIMQRLGEMLFKTGSYRKASPLLAELAAYHENEPHVYVEWEWRHLKSLLAPGTSDVKRLFERAQRLERLAQDINHPDALLTALEIQTSLCYQSLAISSDELPRVRQGYLELAWKFPLTATGASALARAGLDTAMAKNAEEGVTFGKQAMAWAEDLKDQELQIQATRFLASAMYLAGRFDECEQTLQRGLHLIESSGAVLYLHWLLMAHASLLLELDAFPQADRALSRLEAADPETDARTYLFGVANRALMEFYVGNHGRAVEKADEFIAANSIDTWMEITVRGVRGLAELELGRVADAFEEAERVTRVLMEPRYWVGDFSAAFRLLARVSSLRGEQSRILGLLETAEESYSVRDYVCTRGIRLALAEALARSDLRRALTLCESVITDTASKGLLGLNSQAKALLRKLQRKLRS